MKKYWSNTKLADWIRGTPKPGAATTKGWKEWKNSASVANPVRYWVAEELLDHIQNVLYYPTNKLYDIKYYINNRWITRAHALTAHPRNIKPGKWQDYGYRFLPCLFDELVNYVEVELAWWHLAWEGKEARAKYNAPWWRFGWWNVRLWRCPEAGIDNLKWQMNLTDTNSDHIPNDSEESKWIGKPTHQAQAAAEILALYTWWTEVYPNRPNPNQASGWSDFCSKSRGFDICDYDENRKKDSLNCLNRLEQIEEEYDREDEEMLIRLIKIRKSLWT